MCYTQYSSIFAVEDSETETDTGPILQNEDAEGEWVPVCKPEEVPKGAQPMLFIRRQTLQQPTCLVLLLSLAKQDSMSSCSLSVRGTVNVQVSASKREQQGWTFCCCGTEIRCMPLSRGVLSASLLSALTACNSLYAARNSNGMIRSICAWQVTSSRSIQ